MVDPSPIDLTDVTLFTSGEQHGALAWLRENEPVYWNTTGGGDGVWVLSRHEDVFAAYLDSERLSSSGGAMLGGSFRSSGDTAAGRMLVASDSPRHRMLRRLFQVALSAARVRAIETRVEKMVSEALDLALARGGCDFAQDIAPALPAAAVMEIFRVPQEEAYELVALTRRMIGYRDPHYFAEAGDRIALAAVQADLFDFFFTLLDARRRDSGEDFVSILATANINRRPLSDEEILLNCMNMAVGGNETTSYTACAMALAMADNDEVAFQVTSPAVPVDDVVSEAVRWGSTNTYVKRVATENFTIRNQQISAGDVVTLWNASANRDERAFVEPCSFSAGRKSSPHVSYGAGVHRCVGASVARVELAALVRVLRAQQISFGRAGTPSILHSNFIQGMNTLPLTVRRCS